MVIILFSVIIPTFNSRNTILKTIESVLINKEDELEILIVDDGSSDGTVELIKKKNFPYIKIFNCTHMGPANIKNFAIKHAKGNFICFLDSDDLLAPNYFEILRNNLTPKIDLLIFNYKTFRSSTEDKEEIRKISPTISGMDTMVWNKVYSKSIIKKLNFPENTTYEDVGFSVQAFLISREFTYIDKTLYYYRQREGSVTKDPNKPVKIHLDIIKGFKEMFAFIKKYEVDLTENDKREVSILVNKNILMHIRKIIQLYNIQNEESKTTIVKLLNFKRDVNTLLGSRYSLLFSKTFKTNFKFCVMYFLIKIRRWGIIKSIVIRKNHK